MYASCCRRQKSALCACLPFANLFYHNTDVGANIFAQAIVKKTSFDNH